MAALSALPPTPRPFQYSDTAQPVAFLFPGQGSQHVGMAQALAEAYPAAQAVFDEANEILGFDLAGLCFNGPEEVLTDTVNAQPALMAASIAALRAAESVGAPCPGPNLWPVTAWANIRPWWPPAPSAWRMGCAWCGSGDG